MNHKIMNPSPGLISIALIALLTIPLRLGAQESNWENNFRLSSTTFQNNQTLPLSMINNITVNNVNSCTADGSPGGNQSPELSWTRADPRTRSFAVVLYDVTAAFTHWGCIISLPTPPGSRRTQELQAVCSVLKSSTTFSSAPNTAVPVRRRTSARLFTATSLPSTLSTHS
jgi:phosphatidylethanolamine-binding protein (PEBP) family uncharacterized protein